MIHEAVVSACRSNATYILCVAHVIAFFRRFLSQGSLRATVLGSDLTSTPSLRLVDVCTRMNGEIIPLNWIYTGRDYFIVMCDINIKIIQ